MCPDIQAEIVDRLIADYSFLSCVNYPHLPLDEYRGQNIEWVWALDNDSAGQRYTRKWVARSRAEGLKVTAAQVAQGKIKQDWNECHIHGRLTEQYRKEYLYRGSLLIAQSALDKALLI